MTVRLPAAERREQLLDATLAAVERQGFHAVSIEAVAREAGVTRPIVYGHFGDLPGLLEALVDRETERANAQLAALAPTAPPTGDPRELLLTRFRTFLEAVEAEPRTWRLVLMPPEGAPETLGRQIAAGRAEQVAQLAGVLGAVGLGPASSSPDPELTARMLNAMADEAARLVLTDPRRFGVERILAHAGWVLEQLG